MDDVPYSFLDELSTQLTSIQLQEVKKLRAPLWTETAKMHLRNRRIISVGITLFVDPKGLPYDDARFAMEFHEVPREPGRQWESLPCRLDLLKAIDRRFLRFCGLHFAFEPYRRGAYETNLEELIDFVLEHLDHTPSLSNIINSDRFLKFTKLRLYNEGGCYLCQRVLEYQVNNNPSITEMVLRGDADWNSDTKPMVRKYLFKPGHKTLSVTCDDTTEDNGVYVKKWLEDPSFEMELNIEQNWMDVLIRSLDPVLHLLEADDYSPQYGRVHPTEGGAGAYANIYQQDGHVMFSLTLTADNSAMLGFLAGDCQKKDRCNICKKQ
ncbi:hypothetical protein QR680_007393 [Steinernema hermaphroditum]|uniref:F-box domain-containing protein n=1 Tax=Steinernema hermaphroditum TaxID=289476 RepID=A0AA39M5B4_9BILA|nr:hypothetical protein QR680_007393 [Steinernema hermaphroditum]